MQVGAISPVNSYTGISQAEILNDIANLNEDDIRNLAQRKAYSDVNEHRYRKVQNALWASIPVLGGIAAAVTKPGTKIPKLARLDNFGRGFASWAVPFLVVSGIMKAENASTDLRTFAKEHPFLSSIGSLAASLLAMKGLNKVGFLVTEKYGDSLMNKIIPTRKKISKAFDNSKILNKISKKIDKWPSSFKQFVKTALDCSPWILTGGLLVDSMKHETIKSRQYFKNYDEIKDTRNQVRDYLADNYEEI